MSDAWYYAQDGSPKGPVDRSEVEALYREGKIAPDGLVWKEGTPDWVAASSVFGAPPAAGGGAAVPMPAVGGGLDLEDCFRGGWVAFKPHWPMLVTGALIFFALTMVVQVPYQVGEIVINRMGHKPFSLVWWAFLAAYSLASIVISAPLTAGYFLFHLETLRDKPRIESLFEGFRSCWVQSVLGSLVSTLLIGVGLLLLILPGIYLAICYAFTLPLIIDRKMNFWEAMELSRKTVHAQWFAALALVLISGVVMIAGLVLCCVGALGTMPLGYLILMQGYRQLFAAVPASAASAGA